MADSSHGLGSEQVPSKPGLLTQYHFFTVPTCCSMAAGIAEGLGFVSWRPGPIVIILSACVVSLYYIRPKRAARLPPGPRGLPFLGNVLQVPNKQHWLRFAEMGDIWGMHAQKNPAPPRLNKCIE